jgi:hypothetical protein
MLAAMLAPFEYQPPPLCWRPPGIASPPLGEIREFVRSADEVFLVENAFGTVVGKTRHAILRSLPRGLSKAAPGRRLWPRSNRSFSLPPVPQQQKH